MASCPKCSAIVADDAAFCGNCGGPLARRAGEEPRRPGTLLKTVPEAPISAAVKPAPQAGSPAAPPQAPVPGPIAGAPEVRAGAPRRLPAKHLPVGTVVDHKYAISRVLGEGGMGVVYLAS